MPYVLIKSDIARQKLHFHQRDVLYEEFSMYL